MKSHWITRRIIVMVLLCFQIILLIYFFIFAILKSGGAAWDLGNTVFRLSVIYYGVLLLIALKLTHGFYVRSVRRSTLQKWSILCIALSSTPLYAFSDIYLRFPVDANLYALFELLVFLIPTILLFVISNFEDNIATSN